MTSVTEHVIVVLRFTMLVVLIAALGSHLSFAAGPDSNAEDLANKIQSRYEHTADLSADFTQTLLIEGFETPMQSSGRISIKKPGRLYWEYRDPQAEHIYVNGDRVVFYTPAHNQVIQATLSRLAESRAPLHLLQGATRLREHFELEQVEPGDAQDNDRLQWLGLRPKEDGGVESRRRIVIGVDSKNHYIRTVGMHELNGNVTTIHFSNITANSNLPDSLFHCDMPTDVEIIQDLP